MRLGWIPDLFHMSLGIVTEMYFEVKDKSDSCQSDRTLSFQFTLPTLSLNTEVERDAPSVCTSHFGGDEDRVLAKAPRLVGANGLLQPLGEPESSRLSTSARLSLLAVALCPHRRTGTCSHIHCQRWVFNDPFS
jgi:hypothetical protein